MVLQALPDESWWRGAERQSHQLATRCRRRRSGRVENAAAERAQLAVRYGAGRVNVVYRELGCGGEGAIHEGSDGDQRSAAEGGEPARRDAQSPLDQGPD